MRHTILGVQVDSYTRKEAIDHVQALLSSGGSHYIVTLNPEIVILAHRSPFFRAILNNASLSLCDGTGLYLTGKLKGKKFPERICGSDFLYDLCEFAEKNGYSVDFVGATGNIREKTQQVLSKRFPSLLIANPGDITFVALGAPKQEIWMAQEKSKQNRKIMIGVGGAFDMIAGNTRRAPKILRIIGLEWLWRLFLQPSRFLRIWNAVVIFPLAVIRHDM